MPDNTLSDLTEVVVRMKEAFEVKNIGALKSLFTPKPAINVMGRFINAEEFWERLAEFVKRVEQPMLEIVRIEETEVKKTAAFVSYVTEVSFIDEQSWEEHTVTGTLSLGFVRTREGAKGRQKDRWQLEGLTFTRLDQKGEQPPSATPPQTTESRGIFDGLFGIWY